MSSCYITTTTSKTGVCIPCFEQNKPSASLYNPEKEALRFIENIEDGFNIIVGYGCGLHIQELQKKYPTSKIVVVEKNDETIAFLKSCKEMNIPTSIQFCTVDSLYDFVVQTYFAPLDGNLSVNSLRSWVDMNVDDFEKITATIKRALETISTDISTQAQFGKIWHRNIIQNIHTFTQIKKNRFVNIKKTRFPTQKIAYIAGAGPTLDTDIKHLRENRDKYFVFATDTAYSTLSIHNIFCDVVVSVDPQCVSMNHFFAKKNDKTLFAFDLCSNPIPIRSCMANNNYICFFKSEHPLCVLFDNWCKDMSQDNDSALTSIVTESGTVTLSALTLANICGFNTFRCGGCDFAYIKGQMYAKGTYLDTIFNFQSNKLNNSQNLFVQLMYKNTLIDCDSEGMVTTNLLLQYKQAVNNFLNSVPKTNKGNNNVLDFCFYDYDFDIKQFVKYYSEKLENNDEAVFSSILPLCSWFTHHYRRQINFEEILKIALKVTVQI